MASFDIFTQPQGPNIDISLFGDATKAGAAAAQLLPTQLTAGIQGAMQGYDTGLKWQEERQQAEIRQNQIEQLPVINQINQQRLQFAEIQNAQQQLALENQAQNHEEAIAATKSKLQESRQELDYKKNLFQAANEINDTFGKGDAATDENILFGGKFNNYWSNNPDKYISSLNTFRNRGDISDTSFDRATAALEDSTIVRQHTNLSAQMSPKWQAKIAEMEGNGIVQKIKQAIPGFDTNAALSGVQIEKVGTYKQTGDQYDLDMSGNPIPIPTTPGASPSNADARYQAVIKNPTTGQYKVIAEGTEKEFKDIRDGKDAWYGLSGFGMHSQLGLASQLRQFRRQNKGGATGGTDAPSGPPPNAPVVSIQGAPVANKSPEKVAAAPELTTSFTETYKGVDFKPVTPIIKKLDEALQAYKDNPTLRVGVSDSEYDPTVPIPTIQRSDMKTLVDTITKQEFEASKDLQAKYKKKADLINQDIRAARATPFGFYGPEITPYDAYKNDRTKTLTTSLDALVQSRVKFYNDKTAAVNNVGPGQSQIGAALQ